MSTNLHLKAELTGIFIPDDKDKHSFPLTLMEYFCLYETTCEVAKSIFNLKEVDKIKEAYIEFVKKTTPDVQEPVYSPEDFFHTGIPIRFETVNYGDIHIEALERFFKEYEKYNFIWEVW